LYYHVPVSLHEVKSLREVQIHEMEIRQGTNGHVCTY